MTDQELADALVALTIGVDQYEPGQYALLGPIGGGHTGVLRYATAEEIVRDWRVAGAVMERLSEIEYCWEFTSVPFGDVNKFFISYWESNERGQPEQVFICNTDTAESLPRAIIEAGVEALK